MTSLVCCPYCPDSGGFIAPSQILLQKHIKLAHSHEPGFRIECSRPLCTRVFTNYRTYENHLLQHKRRASSSPLAETVQTVEHEADIDEADIDESGVQIEATDDSVEIHNLTDYCAKWILKTSETRHLTRCSSIGIVKDVSELVKEVCTCIEEQVKSCLEDNGLQFNTIRGLSDIFSENNEVVSPFCDLSTFYQQLSYYKRNYGFIVSVTVFFTSCLLLFEKEPRRIVLAESIEDPVGVFKLK